MLLPIRIQFDIVLYALLAGLLTGIMFDLYRIIRGAKVPKFIVFIQDILFWSLAAVIVFTFLLYTNYAFLGAYVYIFMVISLLFYLRFISSLIFKVELIIIGKIRGVSRLIFKNIIYPIKLIYSKISGKTKEQKKIT
ncbi:spore cortex biosynthesis protein YabQ [Clostridium gasigenes]|uniref:Spore cortex biosynthesis protein YabQ n=1 Tax=Clostridium gasigenes TaxID=94869 RepID=A0A1H0TBU4_9CLOT|nr:spore cortex biosynthesis protein YabQ [Clostridium gasigenes]MBB6625477.1 spore cortex biosynthesis protein YabQ [Clostridium gasigenes]MBB6715829.1 spore cortex biosynthesis protein YabQ [Clostridium gasigenes]MBU3088791.1 spore cortex biosynthesis protein YabQ [Clostridium gasigenes]MBU3105785.1 spore cortex biosynthesis protein YabQ [Clostridium gasigenes]MBU3134212.1 spore cortex biosynthesis protein YabQ [Clostridium gasigenes]